MLWGESLPRLPPIRFKLHCCDFCYHLQQKLSEVPGPNWRLWRKMRIWMEHKHGAKLLNGPGKWAKLPWSTQHAILQMVMDLETTPLFVSSSCHYASPCKGKEALADWILVPLAKWRAQRLTLGHKLPPPPRIGHLGSGTILTYHCWVFTTLRVVTDLLFRMDCLGLRLGP